MSPFSVLALALLAATAHAAPTLGRAEAERAFQSANEAYLAGDHDAAAKGYRALLDAGYADPDLYFNLGNAELRAGRRGQAILAYERALRLDPSDPDVRHNLGEARRANLDKVVFAEGGAQEPLWERVVERVPLDVAGTVFLALHLSGFGLVIFRRRLGSERGALLAAIGGAALLSAALAAAALLFAAAWHHEKEPAAVILAATAGVREAPVPGVKSSFEVHEGLKVRVLDREQSWVRIRLPNGLEGWTEAEGLEVI